MTWHFTDHIDLTGGIRFAHNDQQFTLDESSIFETAYVVGQSEEGIATWMIAASYHFTPEVMLYGRVATGSQPGSPNGVLRILNDVPVTAPQELPPTVAAETVTNYELGLKSEFLDRAALFDLSVFYINWDDIQLGTSFGDGSFGLANGGKATSKGVELTSSYVPLLGLRLGYSAAYTQSELTMVSPGAEYLLPGYQLADIPRWSMVLTTNYDWPLTDVWDAHVGGAWRWIDKRWDAIGVQSRSAGGGPTMEMPAYSVLDLNASIARGPLLLRAFVRNLTDTRANLHSFVQGDPANPPASVQARILQPRMIGVGFDYAF